MGSGRPGPGDHHLAEDLDDDRHPQQCGHGKFLAARFARNIQKSGDVSQVGKNGSVFCQAARVGHGYSQDLGILLVVFRTLTRWIGLLTMPCQLKVASKKLLILAPSPP